MPDTSPFSDRLCWMCKTCQVRTKRWHGGSLWNKVQLGLQSPGNWLAEWFRTSLILRSSQVSRSSFLDPPGRRPLWFLQLQPEMVRNWWKHLSNLGQPIQQLASPGITWKLRTRRVAFSGAWNLQPSSFEAAKLATHEKKSPEMDFEWFWTGFLGLSNEFPYYSSQLTWARTSRRQAWGKPGQGLMEIHGFPLRKWSRNSGKGSITNYRYDTIYIYM